MNEGIKQIIYVYVICIFMYMSVDFNLPKKKELMAIPGKWMEPETIVLSQLTEKQKDKYQVSFLYAS